MPFFGGVLVGEEEEEEEEGGGEREKGGGGGGGGRGEKKNEEKKTSLSPFQNGWCTSSSHVYPPALYLYCLSPRRARGVR